MNKLAKNLHLSSTFCANVHGLMNEKSYSTAHDVSLLTHYAMNFPVFREIVAKESHSCKIHNRTYGHTKEVQWINTNKLLSVKGFLGVKTGVTPAAGPCLASCFQTKPD